MEDNKIKCAKCFKEMEECKYKTCDKCREYMRANHQNNKEKRNERRRNHYYEHIDEAKEYARKYSKEHREEINARRRQYRAENVDEVNDKIKWMTCPVCKSELQTGNWKRHTLTKIHQKNINKEQQ